MDLKRNICDNVKECEIKIGYREEDMNLYYPRESLCELLSVEEDNLEEAIHSFCDSVKGELGELIIEETEEKGRFCVRVPSAGVKYIHEHTEDSPFLRAFLKEIFKPGKRREDIVNVFLRFSSDVAVEKISEHEWGIYFQEPGIDSYVYYLEEDEFGLQYHRFTKSAYELIKK